MSIPAENTSGRDEARKALADSRRDRRVSDNVISSTTSVLERMRAINERPDVLADKLRQIIQGGAA